MAASIPTREPQSARAGDTWTWTKSLADYPASTWTLSYYLLNSAGKITITATADGDDHLVEVAAATTAGYTAGDYTWQAQVVSGSEKYTIGSGTIEVLPDLTAASTYDARTHAVKALAAIEAVLERRAGKAEQEYEIEGRRLKNIAHSELLSLRDYYRREVAAEEAAERAAQGLGSGKRVLVRFG